MKNKEYDVIVIGAGPGGSVIARRLSQYGHSVLLIEKREQIGFPVRCGEASTTLEDIESYGPIDEDCIETIIDGLFVYGPGGTTVESIKKDTGIMLNREKFDPYLAKLAEQDGVELVTNARAESVSPVIGKFREVSIVTPQGTEKIKGRMIVGADGMESLVGRMAGLKCLHNVNSTCTGVDIEVEGILTDPRYLTFWQGHDFINDGYIWSFPKVKSNVTNFGAGFLIPKSKDVSIQDITLQWLYKLFPDAKVNKITGGLISVSGNLKEYVTDRLILVGDAAHHTNPLTGGGIAAAMRAAKEGAEVIHNGLIKDDLSKSFLKKYEERCSIVFGKKHQLLLKFRKFLLGQKREDQIEFYKVINTFVKNNFSYFALIKCPIITLKCLYRYLRNSSKI